MVQEGSADHSESGAQLIMMTHQARYGDVRAAIDEIDRLGITLDATQSLRIEEMG